MNENPSPDFELKQNEKGQPLPDPEHKYPLFISLETYRHLSRRRIEESRICYHISTRSILEKRDKRTTCIIKNIPNNMSKFDVIEILNAKFGGRFDIFYLIYDHKTGFNLGYAFINLIDTDTVIDFYTEMEGFVWPRTSKKVARIAYARIQGVANMMDMFRRTSKTFFNTITKPLVYYVDGDKKGCLRDLDEMMYGSEKSNIE